MPKKQKRREKPDRPSRSEKPRAQPKRAPLPTREQLLEYLSTTTEKVGKREIARAFNIRGEDRIALKALLSELSSEGAIVGNRKAVKPRGKLPPVGVLEIIARDDEGELVAVPANWEASEGERPKILVQQGRRAIGPDGNGALSIGDRILARIGRIRDSDPFGYAHEAEPIKRLPRERKRLLGIFRAAHRGGGGMIDPIDRKDLKEWPVRPGNEGDADDGELVRFDIVRRHREGVPEARVAERLGNPQDQRQISLIAIHAHGLPDSFPDAVLAEVEDLPPIETQGRLDLTKLPLVTIDPVDARDHDDAVLAEPDADPGNDGGFIVTVAIADVAHYVRSGMRLDREAKTRGNSVYFPDRVVPMLPERISNDLCSLREGEVRPCLAARMVFDRHGDKRRHTFHRALMRSAAKLSYQEAQAAIDGNPSERAAPMLEKALKPLWSAYAALSAARDRRAPLDLDLPERKIELGEDGMVRRVHVPERLDAHRLIEEFMIQANVAAAETLEQARAPVVYRVHDKPSPEKLKSLRELLEGLDLSFPPGDHVRPKHFNAVLARAKDQPYAEFVNEVILRAQAQAVYDTANLGHFGLNLLRYAHFTSPIRRYADLLVHRSLIAALKLGAGGMTPEEKPGLKATAKDISDAERRAMVAERETIDRLISAFLADRVNAEFPGRISGVTRSGLFVRLRDTGADGFIPASTLGGGEFWRHIEEAHALIGDRSGRGFRLGDAVEVRLVEAIPMAGALRFEMLTEPGPMPGHHAGRGGGAHRRGPRIGNRRHRRR
ncbi:MAG TPA: ribonuclease R [Hyphomicrobiaceae bacterium]|nr:ribonuclease R [Hyphomicrobiaceae bacterium]